MEAAWSWLKDVIGMQVEVDYSILMLFTVMPVVIAFLLLVLQQIFYGSRARGRKANLDNLEALLSGDEEVDIGSIDLDALSRLDDLKDLQTRYQRQVSRNSSAFNLLIFSQYVVGAVLATSLLSGNEWAKAKELLGLVVLISTAIHQRFRPDLLATQAKSRLSRCKKLILATEDGILVVQGRVQKGSHILYLRSKASAGMAELEEMERVGLEVVFGEAIKPPVVPDTSVPKAKKPEAPVPDTPANGAKNPDDTPAPDSDIRNAEPTPAGV